MKNLLKEKLLNNQKVFGVMMQMDSTVAAEAFGASGLDFCLIDTEHAAFDSETVRRLVTAAEVRGVTPIVRIRRIASDFVQTALDMGAMGIVAPGVRSVEDVQSLVSYAKYPPLGARGFAVTRTSAFGHDTFAADTAEYFNTCNRETLVIPQCETKDALDQIEQIAALNEVDAVFIGPYDLSVSLGVPGDLDSYIMKKAVERIIGACHSAGKRVMIFCGDAQRGRKLLAEGIDGIVCNTDVGILIEAFQNNLRSLRETVQPSAAVPESNAAVMMNQDIYSGYLHMETAVPVPAAQAVIPGSAAGLYPADLALLGGKVVIPQAGVISANLYVKGGKIAALSDCVLPAKELIDVAGKYVLPGIIDPHTHFGIGTDFQTDLRSESLSAVVGGITTVGTFISANMSNVADFPKLASDVSECSSVDMVPHFVIGRTEQLDEIPRMVHELGIRTFKVYLNGIEGLIPSMDDAFVIEVMTRLKATGEECILFLHCENHALIERATKLAEQRYGPNATVEQYEDTHPAMAEEEAVMRVAFFAKKLRQPVYIVHVSSADGAEMVAKIKEENRYVFAETTSPYLSVTSAQYGDTTGLMVPPLRTERDVNGLWDAVKSGVIDTIGTDNVTLTLQEKGDPNNVWKAFPGYPALETHLPALLSEGCVKRGLEVEQLVRAIAKRPAELLGLYPHKGTLLPNSDADVVVVDMQALKTVHASALHSRSDFSIHENRGFTGWPTLTIKNGIIVARDGQPTGQRAASRVITRRSGRY